MNYWNSSRIYRKNQEFEVKYLNKKLKFKRIKDNLNFEMYIENVIYVDFHPHINNIFLVCNGKVEIYKINDDCDRSEKICEIKDHSNEIIYASFNPIENLVGTISENNIIKIFDMYSGDIKSSKVLGVGILRNIIEWQKGKIMYAFNDEIFIYDYYNNKIINKINQLENNEYFKFFDNNNIILTNKDSKDKKIYTKIISIVEKVENNIFEKKGINYSLFLQNLNYLILIDDFNITILEINNNFILQTKDIISIKNDNNFKFDHVFDYSYSKVSNNKILLELYYYDCKLDDVKKFSVNIPMEKNIQDNILDINKLKNKIKDFNELNLNSIEAKSLRNYKKKYYKIEAIKDELKKIENDNLLERSRYVERNIKNVNDIKDIKDKYIEILKLLIRDNTNKDLINIYLSFIQENEKVLKIEFENYFEGFNDEKEIYGAFFDEDEFQRRFNTKKINFEKQNVLEILENIINLGKNDDTNKITSFQNLAIKLIKKYEKFLCFNHPINDENSEELIYLNNKLIIIYEFKSILKICNSKNNNNNKKNEIIKIINCYIHEFKKIKELIQNNISLKKIRHLFLCAICSDTIKNFDYNITNIITNNNCKESFEYMIKNPPNQLKLERIKKFLIKILSSKCLETAFKAIYGEDEVYIFNNEEYNTYFINNYIDFLPIKGNLYAVTDKFTLKCFLISLSPEMNAEKFLEDTSLLKYAGIIFTTLHEFGHIIVNHLYYLSNCSRPIDTPRNEKIKECEGGVYFEYALFGDIYDGLNIQQGIFLLKEENYKKNYKEFQNDFESLKLDDLSLTETNMFYKEYEKCKEILNYKYLSKVITIKSKKKEDIDFPYLILRNNAGMKICSKDIRSNYD